MRGHASDWRKFRALDRERRRLVLEAAVLTAAVSAALRTLSVARIRRILHTCSRTLPSRSGTLEQIGWAVRAAAVRSNTRTCLLEALVAECMLRRRSYEPALRLGIRRTPREAVPLDGHAWIECEGAVIVGGGADLADYPRLMACRRE